MNFLVVDDSRTMRYLVQMTLREMGIRNENIIMCESGESALEILRSSQVDFMILDWHLGGMNGLDVLKAMQPKERERIPVVMLTVEQKRRNIELAVKCGASDYIVKPLDPRSFRKRILSVARQNGLDPYGIKKAKAQPAQAPQQTEKTPDIEETTKVSDKEWREVESTIAHLEQSGKLDESEESEVNSDEVEMSLNQADDALAKG